MGGGAGGWSARLATCASVSSTSLTAAIVLQSGRHGDSDIIRSASNIVNVRSRSCLAYSASWARNRAGTPGSKGPRARGTGPFKGSCTGMTSWTSNAHWPSPGGLGSGRNTRSSHSLGQQRDTSRASGSAFRSVEKPSSENVLIGDALGYAPP